MSVQPSGPSLPAAGPGNADHQCTFTSPLWPAHYRMQPMPRHPGHEQLLSQRPGHRCQGSEGLTPHNPPKDGVFVVQVACRLEQDEELGAICVGPAVGHAEHPASAVLCPLVELVSEGGAIHRLSPSACACRIASLQGSSIRRCADQAGTAKKPPSMLTGLEWRLEERQCSGQRTWSASQTFSQGWCSAPAGTSSHVQPCPAIQPSSHRGTCIMKFLMQRWKGVPV